MEEKKNIEQNLLQTMRRWRKSTHWSSMRDKEKSPSERMHKKRRHAAVEKVDALELNERQRSKKKEKGRSE